MPEARPALGTRCVVLGITLDVQTGLALRTYVYIPQVQLAKSHDEYRLVILDPEKATPNTARRAPRVGSAIGTTGSRHSARCAERCTRRAEGLGLTAVAPYC